MEGVVGGGSGSRLLGSKVKSRGLYHIIELYKHATSNLNEGENVTVKVLSS